MSKPQMRDNQGSRAMRDATLCRRDMLRAVGALTVGAAFAEPAKAAAAETSGAGPEPTSWVDSAMPEVTHRMIETNGIRLHALAHPSVAQAQAISPTITGVMVILTVKAGVTREQVMAVMPAEIRQTVQLYLNGKIREWCSRGDGRGVVFLLDSRDVAEVQAIMEGLPLAKRNLMAHEYIAVGPLLPLRLLIANP